MIAVTTHSHTRGLRYTIPMLRAGRMIEKDLRAAPACERYANVIVGPREFWTLTIWRDLGEMRAWMRDGVHGQVIWRKPDWLDCYWGMRWRQGRSGGGDWDGDQWRASQQPAQDRAAIPAADTIAAVPWMQAALGRTVALESRQVAGAAAATYRLRAPPWRLPAAIGDLRRLRRLTASDPDSFESSLGIGTGTSLYLLVVATAEEALDRLQAAPEHRRLLERWGDRAWWSTWQPDSEFGHWQSRRLREGQLAAAPLLVDVALPARLSAPERARHALRTHLRGDLNRPRAALDSQAARTPGPIAGSGPHRRLQSSSLDRTSVEALELLVGELVGNRVQDAGLTANDCIGLQVRGEDDWLRVELFDRGRRLQPQVPLTNPPAEQSRSGLPALDRIAQRWGVVDRAVDRRVWFEVRLPISKPAGNGLPAGGVQIPGSHQRS